MRGFSRGHVTLRPNADQIEVCREQEVVPFQHEEDQPIFLPLPFSGHTLSSDVYLGMHTGLPTRDGTRAEMRESAFVPLVRRRINLHGRIQRGLSRSCGLPDDLQDSFLGEL